MVNLLLNEELYCFARTEYSSNVVRNITHHSALQLPTRESWKYGCLVPGIRWAQFRLSRRVRSDPHPSQPQLCRPSTCLQATVPQSSPLEESILASRRSSSSSEL